MKLAHPGTVEAQAQRGFTLLELLLAILISSFLLAAINGIFYGAMRLRNKTHLMLEEKIPIQQTIAILRGDLAGIVVPSGILSGALKTSTATNATEIYTTTGHLGDTSVWAEVQKVAYALRQPTNAVPPPGMDLVRVVTRNLLPSMQDLPEEQWLLGGVQRIEFTFYNGTQWTASWDSETEESVLPKAVKVRIDLAAEGRDQSAISLRQSINPPIEIVVPILVAANTNQTQNAEGQQ